MTLAAVVAHGSVGLLDELIEFGLPLLVLVALYIWSSRKPKGTGRK